MIIERVQRYEKHGCFFEGDILVVHYFDEMQQNPRWGRPGSGLVFDYLEKSKVIASEYFPDGFEVLLGMLEVVVRAKSNFGQ